MSIIGRIYVISVAALLFSVHAAASFIDRNKASKAAVEFFDKSCNKVTDVELVFPVPGTKGSTSDEEQPPFYIFNRTDGNGFVIVSAESGMRDILAYSDEGIFHTSQMELGAKPFLDSYRQEVREIRLSGAKHHKPAVAGTAGRKQLTTANFDQSGYSFNQKYAPLLNRQPCLSGCVATAMAIIMKYHNWPERNSGNFSYTSENGLKLSFDFKANPFKWSEMSDKPDANSSDAISMLQKACGVSVRMEYGASESYAYFSTVDYALRHYFYYDYPMHIVREDYDAETWDGILHNEIDAGRPVFIGGSSNSGGHAYVLDGYDDNLESYHYNLGWGGINNGFYSDGYISGNRYANTDAIVWITPRTSYEEDFTAKLEYASISTNFDGNLGSNCIFDTKALRVVNYSNEEFSGLISLGLFDKDYKLKHIVGNIYSHQVNNTLPFSWYWDYYLFLQCAINEFMSTEPSDMIMLCTSVDGGNTWQPVYSSHPSFPIRRVGGYATDAPRMSQFISYADKSLKPSGILQQGGRFSVEASSLCNVVNTPFEGNITLALCDTCDWSVVQNLGSVYGQCEEYYSMWVNFNDVIVPADMDVKPSYALALFTSTVYSGTPLPVYDSDYKRVFLMLSDFMEIKDGIVSMPEQDESVFFTIDGRRIQSGSTLPDLYLIQHKDGSVVKMHQ